MIVISIFIVLKRYVSEEKTTKAPKVHAAQDHMHSNIGIAWETEETFERSHQSKIKDDRNTRDLKDMTLV